MRDTIELAREVFDIKTDHRGRKTFSADSYGLEEFATLVRADEQEKYKWDVHSCGPTCKRYACVATREAVQAEREACAKVCETLVMGKHCAAAIRNRGNT